MPLTADAPGRAVAQHTPGAAAVMPQGGSGWREQWLCIVVPSMNHGVVVPRR